MSEFPDPAAPQQTLIFACSGAADVGEIADQAARRLMRRGRGKMACLAAVGAQLADFTDKARSATSLLVIDGCDKDCGRHALENAGISTYFHLRLSTLGLSKGTSPATDPNITRAVDTADRILL